ncbi:Uncharacterised protein [Sphingobacterium thalpophilum]|uniref:DUF4279 domain-containing protein n=2 Tax=Sphingobacterium thalpophilum TaxID=259 RepID=A0A4U9VBR9_9SPHI|nr:Uncharacterised protein [Sphingobacterium thalpophilum]
MLPWNRNITFGEPGEVWISINNKHLFNMAFDKELNLSFAIWDFENNTHDVITNDLGLSPSKIFVKGERISPKISKIRKRNAWIYGPSYGNTEDFETQLNKLLDVLEPRIPILKEYSKKYPCDFSLAYFCSALGYKPPLIHLGKRYHDFIREVDAEFDLDLYYSPLDEE